MVWQGVVNILGRVDTERDRTLHETWTRVEHPVQGEHDQTARITTPYRLDVILTGSPRLCLTQVWRGPARPEPVNRSGTRRRENRNLSRDRGRTVGAR